MITDQTPIIVGVAQWTNKGPALIDPLSMAAKTSSMALDDAASTQASKARLMELIDSVVVIDMDSWTYGKENSLAPRILSDKLGLNPRRTENSLIGGNTPQLKINEACRLLEKGEINAVLITGAEASDSANKVKKDGHEKHNWPPAGKRTYPHDPFEMESRYLLSAPRKVYPLLETAIRAHSGRSPQEHEKYMGELFAKYSKVAAKNPHAWFNGIERTAEEISTASNQNRYVTYPYTKLMNAFPTVNQSASVILTTIHNAKLCGIPEEKWVFPMGGAHFVDVTQVTERRNLHESAAIRNAAHLALKQAGLQIHDIEILDIYSCFPSAVQISLREIGISDKDPRPFTVTGGLPYFGGPGNNYSMHAIVTVTEMIRSNPAAKALVHANGMNLTKEAIGIYGKSKPTYSWDEQFTHFPTIQEEILRSKLAPLVEKGEGPLKVEAFTINYNRTPNQPKQGVVLGTLVRTGERTLANIAATPEELNQLKETELVGKIVNCKYDPHKKLNFVTFSKSNL